MTDVNDQPANLEDISAGLLNGAMVMLLGCAFAGVIAWQIVAQSTGWLPDLKAMSVGLSRDDVKAITTGERSAVIQDIVVGAMLIFGAFGFIQRGVRHIRKNSALLSARRNARPPSGSRL